MSDRPPISLRSPRAALEPEHLPPPPKRSARARNPFVIVGNAIITLILLAMLGAGGAYVYVKQKLDAAGPLTEDKIVTIPKAGTGDIADILQRNGVIDGNRFGFFAGVLALKARSELKSGEYAFAKGATLRDVIETMVDGKVVLHAFTVPEGLTSEQIVARLMDNEILTGSVRNIPPEGSLLPETYKFARGTPREQVIQRMQQAQRRALAEAWERRAPDLPIASPERLVTLASIVEKETSRADERSRVAAVFVNRLQKKMRLQSDPTIIYGLVGGRGTLGRPIKRSEITQASPYNTYVIDGLPPGPIANPGRAALEAAANPARTRDLYFVADGSGGHVFTETYEAHRKNVTKLRALERQLQNDTAEPDPDEEAADKPAADKSASEPPPDTTATTPAAPAEAAKRRAPPAKRGINGAPQKGAARSLSPPTAKQ